MSRLTVAVVTALSPLIAVAAPVPKAKTPLEKAGK